MLSLFLFPFGRVFCVCGDVSNENLIFVAPSPLKKIFLEKASSINWPVSLFWCNTFKKREGGGGAQKKKELVSLPPHVSEFYDSSKSYDF